MWSVGKFLNNKRYLLSSFNATKWIISKQNKKGQIPRLYFEEKQIFHERIDAISQVIRLAFLHSKDSNKIKFNRNKINKLVELTLRYQNINSDDVKIRGSFYWGKTSSGQMLKHPNSWVTFFSIQALMLLNSFNLEKKINFDSFDLV